MDSQTSSDPAPRRRQHSVALSERPRPTAAPSYESLRPSAIRIRRLSSAVGPQVVRPTTRDSNPSPAAPAQRPALSADADDAVTGRRRSSSAPQRLREVLAPPARPQLGREPSMPSINERRLNDNAVSGTAGSMHPGYPASATSPQPPSSSRPVSPSQTANAPHAHEGANPYASTRPRGLSVRRLRTNTLASRYSGDQVDGENEYSSEVIDLLDLVDPEVRTIGTLTNLQNSLFVPDLGGLVNRRPTYDLTRRSTTSLSEIVKADTQPRSRRGTYASKAGPVTHLPTIAQGRQSTEQVTQEAPEEGDIELDERRDSDRISISSELSESRYAVLPHGVSLEGWSDEEVAELNDHVRHLLHSRREGFKRSWRGFRKYISRPLGLFVVVYATLVTLFGAAWVFCLIGWIYVGSRQDYFINVIDNVLVALFALIGDGLAPFRAVDTYHMCFIAHYHHLTWRLRQERELPNLADENDLPDRHVSPAELEDIIDKEENAEFSVLSPRQQKRLQYHQAKFSKSHTFYKPHETATHHAFPLRLLVAVVVLLDCHSLFQVALGTCTWSIPYQTRPEALTATILSCSITCNIMAGVVISIGDHRTRKKEVLERMFRQDLTEQALRRMAKTHTRGQMGLSIDADRLQSQKIRDAHQEVLGLGSAQGPSTSTALRNAVLGDGKI